MSDNATTTAKKKPDYAAYSIEIRSQVAHWTRIGVGFKYKNGGIGIMYDAIPKDHRIHLRELDREAGGAANLSFGYPVRPANFEACNVRKTAGDKSFWDKIGTAYTQEDGDIIVFCEAVPICGKIVLSVPLEKK